jgi:vacuolar-type H+-ATPase subunit I/STV1
MKENNEYKIKWSLSKKASIEAIEDFWMNQEIQDLSNFKIIHKIHFWSFYSTSKSDYLDNKERVVNRHLERLEEVIKRAETKLKDWIDTKERVLAVKMKLLNENENKSKTKLSCGYQLKHLERIEEEIKRAENTIKYYKNTMEQALADKEKLLNENEIEPVKIKLFLLSCGHQLRFEQLAGFLYNGYTKYLKPLKCPYSRECGAVYIVGCYETDLYEI